MLVRLSSDSQQGGLHYLLCALVVHACNHLLLARYDIITSEGGARQDGSDLRSQCSL
jgi:hypothetical protein